MPSPRIHGSTVFNIDSLQCFSVLSKCDVCALSQTRKPLVEKKRRARINESLQELRTLLADTDVSIYY